MRYHFEEYPLLINYGSGSSGNAIILKIQRGFYALLDAGIDPDKIAPYHLNKIKYAFITHEHKDHAQYYKKLLDKGIEVYMTQGTCEALMEKPSYKLHCIKPNNIYEPAEKEGIIFTVIAYPAVHNARQPVMFTFQTRDKHILYAVDTSAIYLPEWQHFSHIIIEANYNSERLFKNVMNGKIHGIVAQHIKEDHMSIKDTIEYLKSEEPEQVYLAHLSKTNADPDDFKEQVQEETGAEVYVLKRREDLIRAE